MKQFLIILMIFVLPATLLAYTVPEVEDMGNVVEEISLLNLLRGIYLNEEQARVIADLAVKAETIRQAGFEEIKKLNSIPVMQKLRDELYTALAENPPAVRKEVVKLDNQAHQLTGKVLHQIAELEDEVKKVLTHGQQNIFWSFVPCIVPELDLENPVRTGQAAASSRLMPAVDLIRKTSEEMWKKHGQAYIDHMLKVIEQDVGRMTGDTREDLRRRLVKQAWKIREMKEADFLIHRSKLAEELLLINREKTVRSGFRITGKFARFFLSSAAARVMPRWVETHFGQKSSADEKSSTIDKPSENPSQPAEPAKKTDAPAAKSDADLNQSKLQNDSEADAAFWKTLVPTSLARLSETPYYDQVYYAFGKSHAQRMLEEEDKYVDFYSLLEEAGVILTREKELTFYNLTQGEP